MHCMGIIVHFCKFWWITVEINSQVCLFQVKCQFTINCICFIGRCKKLISSYPNLFSLSSFNSVPESLGNIYKVLVWHNNGGISPSWYLSRIAVRDLITGHKWYFICERWFAVEEDDGKIERSIDVLKEGVGFQKVSPVICVVPPYCSWWSRAGRPVPFNPYTNDDFFGAEIFTWKGRWSAVAPIWIPPSSCTIYFHFLEHSLLL